jgi:hypothetical protein
VVAIVRNLNRDEASNFSSEPGRTRLLVLEILKGVCTQQYFVVPDKKLAPGQKAVLIVPYTPAPFYDPSRQVGAQPKAEPLVWPASEDGSIDTGSIPPHTRGFAPLFSEEKAKLELVKADIMQTAPEEVGLSQQVVDSVLFPARLEELRRQDPSRAQYVEIVAALRDLPRDVGALADLLESPEPVTRAAAERKLVVLTAAKISRPTDDKAVSLHAWSSAWHEWWKNQRKSLQWNEGKSCWVLNPEQSSWQARWPPIPASRKIPAVTPPSPFIRALRQDDAHAIGAALRVWMDSGMIRDLHVRRACAQMRPLKHGNQLETACGAGYGSLSPAPRFPAALLANHRVSAPGRFSVMILTAAVWHSELFADQRAFAVEKLDASQPCSLDVQRAFFWEEPSQFYNRTPYRSALLKISDCPERAVRAQLVSAFLHNVTDGSLYVVDHRLEAKDRFVTESLLSYITRKCDEPAHWAGRELAQHGEQRVVPIMLQWLRSSRAQCRQAGAFNLGRIPTPGAVPGLLEALATEADASAQKDEVIALAQTGDPRALAALLAATGKKLDSYAQIEVVRGLARIRSRKALPALAAIAQAGGKDGVLVAEAVNAFGYISGLYPANPPWSSGGLQPERMKNGLAVIAQWSQSHRH